MCHVEDGNRVLQTALKLPTPPLSVPVNRQLEYSVENVSGQISSFVLNAKTSSIDCNDGDIRLVGGASDYEGTVEICFGNLWGLIAETGWGDSDAQVVCRQLKYNSQGLVQFYDG